MATITKAYPDTTFQHAANKAAGRHSYCRVLWEMRGPKDTAVAWISCYAVGASIAIVQTYKEGGWDVFTPSGNNNVESTLTDAFNRCGVTGPVRA